jgi:hypothetical protein
MQVFFCRKAPMNFFYPSHYSQQKAGQTLFASAKPPVGCHPAGGLICEA